MAIRSQFPKVLLDAPVDDRISFFKEKKVKHRNLAAAYQGLEKAIRQGNPSDLVIVYGATGVGKTTLCDRFEKDMLNTPNLMPGCIPVSRIEAIAPSSGSFDWKEYYIRGLKALNEPLIDRKCDPTTVIEKRIKANSTVIRRQSTIADLRRALESALRHRGLFAFIVDEAQHLKKVTSGRSLMDQMDTVKSIANTTKVKHVLVGTYELIGLTDLSGQLNRRSIEIHLPRYRYDVGDELHEFLNVVVNLEASMPLKMRPQLSKHIDDIYIGSAGCVGILKDWLTRSYILAVDNMDKSVTLDHLLETKIPDRQMSRIAREISEGEKQLYVEKSEEIRLMLGMGSKKASSGVSSEKKSKRNTRPGERKAKRDPVGMDVVNA